MIEKRRFVLSSPFKKKFYAFIRVVRLKYPNIATFETLRTQERQKRLYQQGSSRTLNSYHTKGLACDLVFLNDRRQPTWNWDYAYIHYIGKMCGMTPIYKNWKLVESCHLQDDWRTIDKVIKDNSDRFNSITNKKEQELLHKCNKLLRKYK